MHHTSVSYMSILVSCWSKLSKKSFYFSPTRTQSVEGTRSVTGTSDKGNTTTITTSSDIHFQRDVWEITFVMAKNNILWGSQLNPCTFIY